MIDDYHLNCTPNCQYQSLEHSLWQNKDRHSSVLKLILLARPRKRNEKY